MHTKEIAQITDPELRLLVQAVNNILTETISYTSDIEARTEQLQDLGLHFEDATHIAYSEAANCDVFLTTDDRLERRGKLIASKIKVRILNPTAYVMEVR